MLKNISLCIMVLINLYIKKKKKQTSSIFVVFLLARCVYDVNFISKLVLQAFMSWSSSV